MGFLDKRTVQRWEPRPYQLKALEWLISRGAAGLFLDPGLGKTAITLGAFKILKDKGMVNKMLVVAPLAVCYNVWPNECDKWEQFNDFGYVVLHGKDKRDDAQDDGYDIYVINPEGLFWFIEEGHLQRLGIDILVIDELTKFKKTKSKRFKAIRPHLKRFQRRWGLTGTPTANGLMDLHGQCFMLDEGAALGPYITHYRRKYFDEVRNYVYVLRPGAREEILDRIRPLCLRMEAEDYIDLPELVYNDIWVPLPGNVMEMYREFEEELYMQVSSGVEITAPSAAALSVKCRQICNGAIYVNDPETGERIGWELIHDDKLDALESLHEQLGDSPALILYEFDHDRERILARLGSIPYIGKKAKPAEVKAAIDRFNAGELPRLLAHPASAGHGLNLQEVSNHVVMFGVDYDFELYDQAMRRIYRSGNPNSHVFIHHLVCPGTVDRIVLSSIKNKDADHKSFGAALKNAREEHQPGEHSYE